MTWRNAADPRRQRRSASGRAAQRRAAGGRARAWRLFAASRWSRSPSAARGPWPASTASIDPSGLDADARDAGCCCSRSSGDGSRSRMSRRCAAIDHHVGRRTVLLSSRRRPARTECGDRRRDGRREDTRRLDHHHADGEEPVPVERPLGSCARSSNCRWPSISTSVLPKKRIMEIYLNIAEWDPASTASRRRRSTISARSGDKC